MSGNLLNLDDMPTPLRAHYMVWTDNYAERDMPMNGGRLWYWTASGPRGHMNGAEANADEAVKRGHLAMLQLERAEP